MPWHTRTATLGKSFSPEIAAACSGLAVPSIRMRTSCAFSMAFLLSRHESLIPETALRRTRKLHRGRDTWWRVDRTQPDAAQVRWGTLRIYLQNVKRGRWVGISYHNSSAWSPDHSGASKCWPARVQWIVPPRG